MRRPADVLRVALRRVSTVRKACGLQISQKTKFRIVIFSFLLEWLWPDYNCSFRKCAPWLGSNATLVSRKYVSG